MIGITMQILGSVDNMYTVATDFFTGTHQRIPAMSKFRFFKNLPLLASGESSADFPALCLCILLIQELPSATKNMQSPLYITIRNLLNVLEVTNDLSLDFIHCRILLTFYEMGHGLHKAAYISLGASARTARALGLHRRKQWKETDTESDKLMWEEEKRAWWAITIMDRFISLCNGDALLLTDDPQRSDPLPIEDLVWSEGSSPADIAILVEAPPSLDTPFNITVGQMARECQISHLVGRAIRHVFTPTLDPEFHAEEAAQLERTLKAYLPLLAAEELRIGKYCAAFGMCNRSVSLPSSCRSQIVY
jgi:hypothetical protein